MKCTELCKIMARVTGVGSDDYNFYESIFSDSCKSNSSSHDKSDED